MVPEINITLRVGHQAEDAPRRVAYAGDPPCRAVGIGGVFLGRAAHAVGILEDKLAILLQTIKIVGIGRQKLDRRTWRKVCYRDRDARALDKSAAAVQPSIATQRFRKWGRLNVELT